MSFKTVLAAATFSTVAATTSFAASPAKIRVSLTGEGGSDMQIKLDQTTIKAGEVVLDVSNDAMTESHELVLVKLEKPDQKISVSKDKHRVDESKLTSIGEVPNLKAGAHGKWPPI
jgi:uncharacterized cupredoxin-like copper-binding protein